MIVELSRQLVAGMAILLLALGPASTAGWFLQRRKRIARNRRRSPLTKDLLRTPGQSLRDQLEERRTDIGFDITLLIMMPLLPLALFYLSSLLGRPLLSIGPLLFVLFCAGVFVAWQIRKMLRSAADMDKLRLGLDAELAVGQELDQLMREGAVVFHDLPAEKFNIDWLSAAVGQRVEVAGVLALPGWYIERKGRGEVLVFSGKELRGNLLKARTARPLLTEKMRQVIHQVEQRCRNVEPSYRPDPVQK